jgi:hypothetical protein
MGLNRERHTSWESHGRDAKVRIGWIFDDERTRYRATVGTNEWLLLARLGALITIIKVSDITWRMVERLVLRRQANALIPTPIRAAVGSFTDGVAIGRAL